MPALVIDGHPDARSLTASLARRYADGHGDARVLALRDLDFDPHLRFGYRERMTLEPDLVDARQALHDAETIVVATPLWWGSVPAVLKGFFDRALLPQQEYRYTKLGLPEGLLPARRGRLLLLADTPWFAVPFTGLPAQTQVARNTLRLCGVRSVRVHRMLGVKDADTATIARWLDRAERLGTLDGRRAGVTPQLIAAEAASSSVVATS
ncbi:NAD(P)H-dependent oxidoreductase [Microbacterium aurugineum]|uniref:NAD(P)H-dependent oxidoreductase n=1 Tax=Microbacterium aurugineum TaxID=2851642 RepID=UPI0020BEE891|nr:NAD(P)H-dependent oxidoreductase [Microbacterium aurugineum]MCK8478171.1 NAD(P)H-dependent oxidoreductase [Microbacterium aurugineum]